MWNILQNVTSSDIFKIFTFVHIYETRFTLQVFSVKFLLTKQDSIIYDRDLKSSSVCIISLL